MHDLKRAKLKLGNQYIIPFSGLKEGEHDFRFDFSPEFFDEHEVLEAESGTLTATVLLDKKPSLLDLQISIEGIIRIRCDRCLDMFDFPIHYQGDLVVKFGEDLNAGTDEIWILHPSEYELDLEQYFFECIGLCLPIKKVHPDRQDGGAGCNTEMLRILGSHGRSEEIPEEPDPRWNKLKNILNDTNNN